MTDLTPTHGLWGDLCKQEFTPADSDFSIIGVPYDAAASARSGAAKAPERLRFWSGHVTPFSEDRTRLSDIRIADLGDIKIADQARDFELVRQKIATLPNMPIILGGDHSITIPVFQGQVE